MFSPVIMNGISLTTNGTPFNHFQCLYTCQSTKDTNAQYEPLRWGIGKKLGRYGLQNKRFDKYRIQLNIYAAMAKMRGIQYEQMKVVRFIKNTMKTYKMEPLPDSLLEDVFIRAEKLMIQSQKFKSPCTIQNF